MLSDSIPPASASAMAARSTRSLLSGIRGWWVGSGCGGHDLTSLRRTFSLRHKLTPYARGEAVAVMELHQERTTTHHGTTMKAIVSRAVRPAGRARAARRRHAGDRGPPGVASRARVVRQPGRVVRRDRAVSSYALFGGGLRKPKSTTVGADLAGTGRSRRQGRDGVPAGRRGVRHVGCRLGRVRARPRGSPGAEAGQRVVRGSGGRPGRGDHRPPGAARQRAASSPGRRC